MQNNKIGSGLHNLGNTCFFNAVIQIMLYTPSLQTVLREKIHSNLCKKEDWCIFCALQKLWHQTKKSRVVSPHAIVSNLKLIFKKFRLGRQEDSHQFLRYLVEGMQQAQTGKLGKDRQKNEKIISKTLTYENFGGKIRTFVLCLNCHHKSLTTQRYYDLSIQCQRSNTLQEGLQNFFKVDDLVGSNKYRCDQCKQLSNAKKGFKLINIPSAVTFQFKRFTNTLRKIGKIIQYPKIINLGRYMQNQQDHDHSKLQLYGVIVHSGSSAGSGHYYAFVKNGSEWFEMNDSNVSRCNEERALRQQAYLLFYRRIKSSHIINQPLIEPTEIMTNIKDNVNKDVKFNIQNIKQMTEKTPNQKKINQKLKNGKKVNEISSRKQSQQQFQQTKRKLSVDIEQLKQQARKEQQQKKIQKKKNRMQNNLKQKPSQIVINGKKIESSNFSQVGKNNAIEQNNVSNLASRILQRKKKFQEKTIEQKNNQQPQQSDEELQIPDKLVKRKSKQQAFSQMGIFQMVLTYAEKIHNMTNKIHKNQHRAMKSVYNLRKFQIASKRRKMG